MSENKDFHFENKDKDVLINESILRNTIEELEFKNSQLEKSLKRIKEEKKRAENSDKLKTIFLANMSHEIRTPMNSIVGVSNILLNKPNKNDLKRYLKIINRNSEELLNLLNDIVDFSKIEINELKINETEFSLSSLMDEIYSSFSFNEELIKKNIDFNYYKGDNKIIIFDRYRLKQVINNLISNSIKFTINGHINFGYYFVGDKLKFYVKDSGIGIDKEYKNKIFDRFFQINVDESRKDGTGLGLSISKGIIKLLNGNINFRSIKGKGTIFYFTIPIKILNNNNNYTKKNIVKNYNFKNKNILIAEDIDDNYQVIYEILKDTNCNTKWVKNGLDCLNEFKKNKYDLILLDMRMPVMSGYDTLYKIRELDKDIPIIVQTAYALLNDKERLIKMGFTDYISKPLKRNKLLDIISKFIF